MKILVAVKNKLVRSAIGVLINQNGNKDKIIEAYDYINLLRKLSNMDIDIVLVDWDFFNGDTIEIISLLKKAYKEMHFIILGISKKNKKAALEANIDAFYIKSDSPYELLEIIKDFRENKLR